MCVRNLRRLTDSDVQVADVNDTTLYGINTAFVVLITFWRNFPLTIVFFQHVLHVSPPNSIFCPPILSDPRRLSAYLAQATGNTTYLSAATDSGAFMIDVMQVTSPGNGAVSISANASANCGNIWGAGSFLLEHTGWFMEGLAVLSGNTTLGQQSVSVDTLSVTFIVHCLNVSKI